MLGAGNLSGQGFDSAKRAQRLGLAVDGAFQRGVKVLGGEGHARLIAEDAVLNSPCVAQIPSIQGLSG